MSKKKGGTSKSKSARAIDQQPRDLKEKKEEKTKAEQMQIRFCDVMKKNDKFPIDFTVVRYAQSSSNPLKHPLISLLRQ